MGTTSVHSYMVLTYFTAGRATVEQGRRFDLCEGDVYLIPAGINHAITSVEAAAAWSVELEPACLATTSLETLLTPFRRAASGGSKVVSIKPARQRHVAMLCEELHRETNGGSGSARARLVRQSLLSLLLAEVGRAAPRRVEVRPGLVDETLRIIERRCLGPLSVTDVARAVGRSPSHLSTAVRQATGRSVKQWIIAGRLAEACSLLRHTAETIEDIAERVGYADPTHFIRLFRREHGASPAAWRRRHR